MEIELGRNPNTIIDTLERIAKVLGLSVEKLFK
jgi:hypothetical protein